MASTVGKDQQFNMVSISTRRHEIFVGGEWGPFTVSLSTSKVEDGLDLVAVRFEAAKPAVMPQVSLWWEHPAVDIHAHWNPISEYRRGNDVNWGHLGGQEFRSKATSGAPVTCLHNFSGLNRLTFALSDALNEVRIKAGIHEETAQFLCSFDLFIDYPEPVDYYEATLRLDTRELPYYESLRQVQQWWAAMPHFTPAPVPETARLPMYSTWYSFHLDLEPKAVEEQCRLAKALGCEAVIVDDGWQTTSNARGYAFVGDWTPAPEVFPDLPAHVKRVHDLGMKYLLWFSVPFVGRFNPAWAKFQGKLIDIGFEDWRVLDPRYPDVREYLIGLYERAIRDWDLDGLKLDFVDSFAAPRKESLLKRRGRDIEAIPHAVDRLMTDAISRLRKLKPEIMIEFRQTYIGPLMRKYGNMFRANDCPNDSLTNRIRTLDVRLLAGNTATHSDMLMWNPTEPVESAALQIINILFSVPQFSMLINKLPPDHCEMAKFWLSFWRKHRDALLDGELMPLHPEALYPVVIARTAAKSITALYSPSVVSLENPALATHILVNGTLDDHIVADVDADLGVRTVTTYDCLGHIVNSRETHLDRGLVNFAVPPSGLIEIGTR
jgi:alpha-galactosidase